MKEVLTDAGIVSSELEKRFSESGLNSLSNFLTNLYDGRFGKKKKKT